MKICNNKKYRTRDGRPVVIARKRVKGSCYPVRGRFAKGLRIPVTLSWTEDGRYLLPHQKGCSHLDLVEVP